MWLRVIFLLSICATVYSFNFDKATTELLSKFNSMNDVPLSKDIGKLRRFKEELSEFSKSIVPLAESFAQSLNESKADIEPISNLTSAIREKLIHLMSNHSLDTQSIDLRYLLSNYDEHVSRTLTAVLLNLQLLSLDSGESTDVDRFVMMCTKEAQFINYIMTERVGRSCLHFKFSQRAVSILSTLIYSCKIATYQLTREEQEHFNEMYSDLYFHLQGKGHIETSSFIVQMFLRDRKDFIYENKVKLLQDVKKLFDVPYGNVLERDCLPMSAFILHQFNSDKLLQIGDILIGHIYASKYITYMCANITHFGNSTAAEKYVTNAERDLSPVYSVVSEWLESLMESTWPKTETELISGLMKEASEGLPIPQNATEYQKVAKFVHDKMKSIGHPRYNRHYLVTKEHEYYEHSYYSWRSQQDFDLICNKNICSHVASLGAQCVTVRTEKEKTEYDRNAQTNFKDIIKPKIMDAFENQYYNSHRYPETMANRLRSDPDIDSWFRNHSSYGYLHSCEYWKHCGVLYGFKSEEEEEAQSVQLIHYHNDGSLLSNCHDSLLVFGV